MSNKIDIVKTHGCFAGYDSQKQFYFIGNEYIRLELAVTAEHGLAVRLLSIPESEGQWAQSAKSHALLTPEDLSHTNLSYRLHELESGGVRLELMSKDLLTGLERSFWYECLSRTAVLIGWQSFKLAKNKSPVPITGQPSIQFGLASDKEFNYQWIEGIHGEVPYHQEEPHHSYRIHEGSISDYKKHPLELYSGVRSSEHTFGWFTLQQEWSQETFFLGVEWSGEWNLSCSTTGLSAGLTNYHHIMQPRESIVFPRFFIGLVHGDKDTAAAETQKYLDYHVLPDVPGDFPWVMYNTWFSYHTQHTEAEMKQEIDASSQIRCDGFYLDAGWYAGSPSSSAHADNGFSQGLGSWQVNQEKYPAGLRHLSDYVHAKGLKFGLWVEPERVAENTRNMFPDGWTDDMIATKEGIPYTQYLEKDCKVHFLCLGNPKTREWIKSWLTRLISENRVDWLKWDNNFWGACQCESHGHQKGDGSFTQIMGFYEILDDLRAKFPKLMIENCASGGNRMDFGVIRHLHSAWLHDDSFSHQVVRYHLYGAGYMFPHRYRNVWVIQDGDLTQHGNPLNSDIVENVFRSRMLGNLGVSLIMKDWSMEFKSLIRQQIELYKKIKPLLKNPMMHLTPQPEIIKPAYKVPSAWEAYQFMNRQKGQGVLFYFRNLHHDSEFQVQLKNLKPNGKYELKNMDTGEKYLFTGAELTEDGFLLVLERPETSGIYLINEK